jgi:hypothetical protein
VTLTQKGSTVTGRHRLKFLAETVKEGVLTACRTRAGGTITGTVRGRKLRGTMSFPNATGAIYLRMSPGGSEFLGSVNIRRGPCKGAWGAFNATRKG